MKYVTLKKNKNNVHYTLSLCERRYIPAFFNFIFTILILRKTKNMKKKGSILTHYNQLPTHYAKFLFNIPDRKNNFQFDIALGVL